MVCDSCDSRTNNHIKHMLEQNYLKFNHQFYKQNQGLAMGAPKSVILAETFIQYVYLGHMEIIKILNYYYLLPQTHVDNLLIIYKHTTNGENTLKGFNSDHPQIKVNYRKENMTN